MDNEKISDWLDELAAKQPTPGGGAAAALMAATAAALFGMVSIFTTGEKWADHEEQMQGFSNGLEKIRAEALKLADEDAKAFAKVSEAYKMPNSDDVQKTARSAAIQNALEYAAEPPLMTAQLVEQMLPIATELSKKANPNVVSDVAVGAACAKAALESALVNIEINKKSIKNPAVQEKLAGQIQQSEKMIIEFEKVFNNVRNQINNGANK